MLLPYYFLLFYILTDFWDAWFLCRRRRVFAGGSFLIGIGIYFNFFRHSKEAEGE